MASLDKATVLLRMIWDMHVEIESASIARDDFKAAIAEDYLRKCIEMIPDAISVKLEGSTSATHREIERLWNTRRVASEEGGNRGKEVARG